MNLAPREAMETMAAAFTAGWFEDGIRSSNIFWLSFRAVGSSHCPYFFFYLSLLINSNTILLVPYSFVSFSIFPISLYFTLLNWLLISFILFCFFPFPTFIPFISSPSLSSSPNPLAFYPLFLSSLPPLPPFLLHHSEEEEKRSRERFFCPAALTAALRQSHTWGPSRRCTKTWRPHRPITMKLRAA